MHAHSSKNTHPLAVANSEEGSKILFMDFSRGKQDFHDPLVIFPITVALLSIYIFEPSMSPTNLLYYNFILQSVCVLMESQRWCAMIHV